MTDYCELDDVKTQINRETDTKDEAIEFLITRASRAIDAYCGREDNWFVALDTATARTYPGSGKTYQHIDECVEVSSVAVKDTPSDTDYTSWDSTDWMAYTGSYEYPIFHLTPYMAIMIDLANGNYKYFTSAGTYHQPTVQVTAKWGYAVTVPPQIEEACIIQVARWLKRAQSSWADAIARGDFGELRFTKKLDGAIAMLLEDGRFVDPRGRK